jgi:hypothetical protein
LIQCRAKSKVLHIKDKPVHKDHKQLNNCNPTQIDD